jgi:hypothetical protein
MLLLCLIASVCGTPLRQAEAASDFARLFTEFGHGDVIEMPDGGVGDDENVSIIRVNAETYGLAAMLSPESVHVSCSPPISAFTAAAVGDVRMCDLSRLRTAVSHRWFAWLQCFLF